MYTYPYNESLIGNDISYQEHVRKIITTHKPVISDVFMSVQGFLAVAIHFPIFKGQEYAGSLAILIKIDKVGKLYLEKIKIRGSGKAWIITENGTEIYCPIEDHTGKLFLDITHNDSTAIKFAEKIKNETKGTGKGIHQEVIEDGQKKFVEKYMVFYRVPLDNTFWTIVISYQDDDVYSALASFRNRLILIFSFIFIVLAYYFFSLTKVRTVLKEEAKRQVDEENKK